MTNDTTEIEGRAGRRGKRLPVAVGETFALLTVISDSDKRTGGGLRYVHVRCECGIEKESLAFHLRSGKTRSCGDRKHAKSMAGMPITRTTEGERYGRLTTSERVGSTAAGHVRWRCSCDCGGKTVVTSSVLRSGTVRSCGCLARGPWGEVGYAGAHSRMRNDRGSASSHLCVDCGEAGSQWSLDWADDMTGPIVLELDPEASSYGRWYSLSPLDYASRCGGRSDKESCHGSLDEHVANGFAAAASGVIA